MDLVGMGSRPGFEMPYRGVPSMAPHKSSVGTGWSVLFLHVAGVWENFQPKREQVEVIHKLSSSIAPSPVGWTQIKRQVFDEVAWHCPLTGLGDRKSNNSFLGIIDLSFSQQYLLRLSDSWKKLCCIWDYQSPYGVNTALLKGPSGPLSLPPGIAERPGSRSCLLGRVTGYSFTRGLLYSQFTPCTNCQGVPRVLPTVDRCRDFLWCHWKRFADLCEVGLSRFFNGWPGME